MWSSRNQGLGFRGLKLLGFTRSILKLVVFTYTVGSELWWADCRMVSGIGRAKSELSGTFGSTVRRSDVFSEWTKSDKKSNSGLYLAPAFGKAARRAVEAIGSPSFGLASDAVVSQWIPEAGRGWEEDGAMRDDLEDKEALQPTSPRSSSGPSGTLLDMWDDDLEGAARSEGTSDVTGALDDQSSESSNSDKAHWGSDSESVPSENSSSNPPESNSTTPQSEKVTAGGLGQERVAFAGVVGMVGSLATVVTIPLVNFRFVVPPATGYRNRLPSHGSLDRVNTGKSGANPISGQQFSTGAGNGSVEPASEIQHLSHQSPLELEEQLRPQENLPSAFDSSGSLVREATAGPLAAQTFIAHAVQIPWASGPTHYIAEPPTGPTFEVASHRNPAPVNSRNILQNLDQSTTTDGGSLVNRETVDVPIPPNPSAAVHQSSATTTVAIPPVVRGSYQTLHGSSITLSANSSHDGATSANHPVAALSVDSSTVQQKPSPGSVGPLRRAPSLDTSNATDTSKNWWLDFQRGPIDNAEENMEKILEAMEDIARHNQPPTCRRESIVPTRRRRSQTGSPVDKLVTDDGPSLSGNSRESTVFSAECSELQT